MLIPPIYGDMGDGLVLFYPHEVFFLTGKDVNWKSILWEANKANEANDLTVLHWNHGSWVGIVIPCDTGELAILTMIPVRLYPKDPKGELRLY